MAIPLSTQTFRSPTGIQVASSNQPTAMGGSPANGSRTANGYTVFDNRGGGGSAMNSSGQISSGSFTFNSRGQSVFVKG